MSLTRTHNKVTFICDECGEHLDTLEEDFKVALEIAKENNWSVARSGDGKEYVNICADCDEGPQEVNFDG